MGHPVGLTYWHGRIFTLRQLLKGTENVQLRPTLFSFLFFLLLIQKRQLSRKKHVRDKKNTIRPFIHEAANRCEIITGLICVSVRHPALRPKYAACTTHTIYTWKIANGHSNTIRTDKGGLRKLVLSYCSIGTCALLKSKPTALCDIQLLILWKITKTN